MRLADADASADQGFSPEQTAQAILNLRCAVDHCHDVILITDALGRIEFVNPSFQVLTGFPAKDALGRDVSFFAERSSNSGNYKSSAEQLLDTGSCHQIMELRRKEGGTAVLDFRIAAVRNYEAEI